MHIAYNHSVHYINCLLLAIGLTTTGCGSSDKYDKRFNPTRAKLFLPQIEKGWKSEIFQLNRFEKTWRVDNAKLGACHATKKYRWNETGLLWESDMYYSGKRIPALPSDPDREWVDEGLLIRYCFQETPALSKVKAGDWFFYYFGPEDRELNIKEALLLLKKWGLSHPLMNRTMD